MKIVKNSERAKYARRLGKLINKVLAQHDLKICELAKELGVPEGTMYGWATGKKMPKTHAKYEELMANLNYLLIKEQAADPEPDELTQLELELTPPVRQCLTPAKSALDVQVGGDHYKDSPIQPLEYIEANRLDFLEGCVIKRITRHGKPSGKGAEDIRKVIHEAQLILEMRYGELS